MVLISLASLAACGEVSDGAVWRYVWLSNSGSALQIAGAECLNVRNGTSHSIEGKTEFDYAAFYTMSQKGKLHQELYIVPENAPAGFDLTVDNGELAQTYDLNRSSFAETELLEDEIPTYTGETVNVVHWFEEECRSDATPPESFTPPTP